MWPFTSVFLCKFEERVSQSLHCLSRFHNDVWPFVAQQISARERDFKLKQTVIHKSHVMRLAFVLRHGSPNFFHLNRGHGSTFAFTKRAAGKRRVYRSPTGVQRGVAFGDRRWTISKGVGGSVTGNTPCAQL